MKKIAIILLVALAMSITSCSGSSGPSSGGNNDTHKVTFAVNGGTPVAAQEVASLDKAPQTTKEAHVFCGWFLDQDLKNPVVYPLKVKSDMTLYAKWTKSTDQIRLEDSSVQFSVDDSYNYKAEYVVNPQGLDLQALADQGYYVKIDVTYEAYYVKDYDVPFDFGYLGAPDHDAVILDTYDKGAKQENLPTTTEPQAGSVSIVVSASELLEMTYRLKLITYNVQNVVYFQNIVVNYSCVSERP